MKKYERVPFFKVFIMLQNIWSQFLTERETLIITTCTSFQAEKDEYLH